MVRYVTISKFASISGYTENAIRSKIRDDIWQERSVWIRAPDNRILIDTQGYEAWVLTGRRIEVGRRNRPRPGGSPPPLA